MKEIIRTILMEWQDRESEEEAAWQFFIES